VTQREPLAWRIQRLADLARTNEGGIPTTTVAWTVAGGFAESSSAHSQTASLGDLRRRVERP